MLQLKKYIAITYPQALVFAFLLQVVFFLALPINVNWTDGMVYLSGVKQAYPHYPFLYPAICHTLFTVFDCTNAGIYAIVVLQWIIWLACIVWISLTFYTMQARIISLLLLSVNLPVIVFLHFISAEGLFCSLLMLIPVLLYRAHVQERRRAEWGIYVVAIVLSFLKHLGVVFAIVPAAYYAVCSVMQRKVHRAFYAALAKAALTVAIVVGINALVRQAAGTSNEVFYGRPTSYRMNDMYLHADSVKKAKLLRRWQEQTPDTVLQKTIVFIAQANPSGLWLNAHRKTDSLLAIIRENDPGKVLGTADFYFNEAYFIYLRTMGIKGVWLMVEDIVGIMGSPQSSSELVEIICYTRDTTIYGKPFSALFDEGGLLHTNKICENARGNLLLKSIDFFLPNLLLVAIAYLLFKRRGKKVNHVVAAMLLTALGYGVLHTVFSIFQTRYTLPNQVIYHVLCILLVIAAVAGNKEEKYHAGKSG